MPKAASAARAVGVALTVLDRQQNLGVLGHHAHQGSDPHPEHGAGAADEDSAGDARNVAGADGGGKGGGQGLEGRNLTRAGLVLVKEFTGGVLPPVGDAAELRKAHPDTEVEAGADEQ